MTDAFTLEQLYNCLNSSNDDIKNNINELKTTIESIIKELPNKEDSAKEIETYLTQIVTRIRQAIIQDDGIAVTKTYKYQTNVNKETDDEVIAGNIGTFLYPYFHYGSAFADHIAYNYNNFNETKLKEIFEGLTSYLASDESTLIGNTFKEDEFSQKVDQVKKYSQIQPFLKKYIQK